MKTTQYVARQPDDNGFIHYPETEHQVWNTLITRQLKVIEGRACQEYLDGIEQLGLPHDRIPQLDEINRVLQATTGWRVARVPALIPFQTFFELLASQQFPVATFIRTLVILVTLGGILAVLGKFQAPGSILPRSWLFLVLSGLATGASWICYFRALKLGPASLVAPLDKFSVVLVALLGVAFLGERLDLRQWLGVALVTAGVVVLAIRP